MSTTRSHRAMPISKGDSHKRRAATVVMVAVMVPVLLGIAALTIDVGAMYSVRNDLQISADSAALAAAAAYASDSMLQIRLGYGGDPELYDTMSTGYTEVDRVSALNHSFGIANTAISSSDVNFGWIDITSGTSPLDPTGAPSGYNAVQVMVRRTAAGTNGALDLFFAPIFGRTSTEVTASAVAILDDRFEGYDVSDGGAALWPFTVSETIYQQEILNGGDNYGFDSPTATVLSGPDGVREVNLYPYVFTPGNFGLLNIGRTNNGAQGQAAQIEDGVSEEEAQNEIGSSTFLFYDSSGNPITYTIGGTPGLKASLESAVETRVGEVVAYLLHDQATGNGANTNYRITTIVFGRVMDVKLQGAASSRGLWLQPVVYVGAGVIVTPTAPSSNGEVGQIVLAR